VTEGAASNAWIVTADGIALTRPTGHDILGGISRAVVKDVLADIQVRLTERPFTVAEALAGREAFITAATQLVMPVVRIDGRPIGEGKPGPVALALREAFHRHAELT